MRGKWRAQRADRGAHAARGFVGGTAKNFEVVANSSTCFNAARGFVGGAAYFDKGYSAFSGVSMPHAALWVVQPRA